VLYGEFAVVEDLFIGIDLDYWNFNMEGLFEEYP